jgi:hypothetical protein
MCRNISTMGLWLVGCEPCVFIEPIIVTLLNKQNDNSIFIEQTER